MPVFRERVRDAFMVISVFSEWPESLGSLLMLCQKHYLAFLPRTSSTMSTMPLSLSLSLLLCIYLFVGAPLPLCSTLAHVFLQGYFVNLSRFNGEHR